MSESSLCVCAKSLQSCLTLCNPLDCSLPGSSSHGILQARILEWAAMPSSRGCSQPRDRTRVSHVSCIGRRVLYPLPPGKSNLVIPKLRQESLEDESSLIWEDQVREMVCVSLGVTGYNSNIHAQRCHSPRQSHILPGGKR